MSFADDHPDLINFNQDNLHLPSFHAGLTLTEMLDPAFDHLWLNFDASEHYSAKDHVYNDTLFSDYLPFIPSLSIVHGSTDIPEEPLFDDAEYRRSSLQRVAPNDLADDALALPSHIAVTHSPEASAAPLLDGSAEHPLSKAASQPGPAFALFSDGGESTSGSQHEWHPADLLDYPHVASSTAPSTPPVYSQLSASPSSSSSLLTDVQQASCDTQSSGTPESDGEGLGFTVKEPGARNFSGENHFDQFNLVASTYNGAACMPMIAATPIAGGLESQLRSLEQVDSLQDFLYPASSQRLSELTGFDGCRSLGRAESLDGQHSALCHNHRLPDKHVRRYTDVDLPAVALEAQQSISQKYHLIQYPYDQPENQQWSSPGSGTQNQLGSYNEYLLPIQRSQASTHDWRSHHVLPESGYPLPASSDTSVLMSDSEYPPICESLPPKRSSLAQRRTRRLAMLDTKPYSRQNPICPEMARRRKADVFNPARAIHCTLRVDRGDRKGQKCNVWCEGVDAFTKHLKDDGHNFSPCKVPLSTRPGPDYAPDDDGLPMEWGFCTWDEDNDCETFKMRRSKSRLGPMSGGDLIRHIREAHAGVPR